MRKHRPIGGVNLSKSVLLTNNRICLTHDINLLRPFFTSVNILLRGPGVDFQEIYLTELGQGRAKRDETFVTAMYASGKYEGLRIIVCQVSSYFLRASEGLIPGASS